MAIWKIKGCVWNRISKRGKSVKEMMSMGYDRMRYFCPRLGISEDIMLEPES